MTYYLSLPLLYCQNLNQYLNIYNINEDS